VLVLGFFWGGSSRLAAGGGGGGGRERSWGRGACGWRLVPTAWL
jgi:hypothetical protein